MPGATVHAYGIKTAYSSFGNDGGKKIKRLSLLKEAQQKGFQTGLCQSGILTEPGTAVFASTVTNRKQHLQITEQLIHSNVTVLLGGGEKYLLPQGIKGRFGSGVRTDKKKSHPRGSKTRLSCDLHSLGIKKYSLLN